jgi:hypothetical protein
MQTQSSNEVKSMAERLKAAPTDNPEVKFLLARAFTLLGDANSSKAAVEQAKELMNKTPATKADLEKKYADLLSPGSVASNSTDKTKGKRTTASSEMN